MRAFTISIAVFLAVQACAPPEQRIEGYLTSGCGDRYIKPDRVAETWFVELTPAQQHELKRLRDPFPLPYSPPQHAVWETLRVTVTGIVKAERRPGFFRDHARRVEVTRVVAVEVFEPGASVHAATEPARRFKGYLTIGPESVGFVPLTQVDEYWWVVPGRVGLSKVYEPIAPPESFQTHPRLETALVEILGRVGPPGDYASGGFIREVAVDDFTFVRSVGANELDGTAAVEVVDGANTNPRINKCERPTR